MHELPSELYRGFTIVVNPVETIERRFLVIFTVYDGCDTTFPLAYHHGPGVIDFLTESRAAIEAFASARKWIDDKLKIKHLR